MVLETGSINQTDIYLQLYVAFISNYNIIVTHSTVVTFHNVITWSEKNKISEQLKEKYLCTYIDGVVGIGISEWQRT